MPGTPILWTATVTLLIGFFYFYTGFRVGGLRAKHGVKAPAISGHPEFDRAYRIQLNTLEQMGITLPFLWIAVLCPLPQSWLAPTVGFFWVLTRIPYLRGYMRDPEKRLPGAMLGGICNLLLFFIAAVGVVLAWTKLPMA